MRAIAIRGYGGPERLEVLEVPEPEVQPDQVLIRVRAAGVAYSDVKMRRGDFGTAAAMPLRIGLEVAGTVERCGAGVDRLQVGDGVYAYLSSPGGYAELVAERAALVAHKPSSIDFPSAAAVPLAAITADTAVTALGLPAGSTAFIAGGAGGVGSFAVQIAAAAGIRVIVSGRVEDEAYVRSLGAAAFVDFRRPDAISHVRELAGGGANGAIDAVGAESAAGTLRAVTSGGRLVDLGWSGELGGDGSVEIVRFSAEPSGERLTKIAGLIDAGKLKVTVERTFGLEEARLAHELVEARRVRGKLVLIV